MQNNFYLPFTDQQSINLIYIMQNYIKTYSNYLNYPNTNILGVYGSFPKVIWNGGRTIPNNDFDNLEKISNCLDDFNQHNLVCKFTFTNQLLEKKHLDDEYCNKLLNLINTTNNEITIHSQILEDYILKNYPKIPLTSSITKGIQLDTFKESIEKNIYSMVVCYPRRNILEYISTLSPNNQNKVELLINSGCGYCKVYKEHYKIESLNNLNNSELIFNCYRRDSNYDREKDINKWPFEEQLIDNIELFQDLNIHTYKIQGRCQDIKSLAKQYSSIFFIPGVDEIVFKETIKNIDFL